MHTYERQAEQLKMAGIKHVPPPDLAWVGPTKRRFHLSDDFALLVPGGAQHRPEKRWPAAYYAGLGRWLASQGILPVLLGGADEGGLHSEIRGQCPDARRLAGQTAFQDIVALARRARLAVGNDTGPMHLIAAAGCRSFVLFSGASDPSLCAQRGADVSIVQRDALEDLSVEEMTRFLMQKGLKKG